MLTHQDGFSRPAIPPATQVAGFLARFYETDTGTKQDKSFETRSKPGKRDMTVPSPDFLYGLLPLLCLGGVLLFQKPLTRLWPGIACWLRRRHWPRTLRVIHVFLIGSFLVLMVSGVAIYLPALHGVLLPWLQTIYMLHVWLGTVFLLALILALFMPPQRVRRVRILDWIIVSAGGLFLGVSGYVLWFDTDFPLVWNAIAFGWHGWVAYILMGWLLFHALLRAVSFQQSGHPLNWRVDFTRRRFIAWGGAWVASSFGLLSVGGWLHNDLDSVDPGKDEMTTSDAAAQWAFPERYSYVGRFPQIDLADYHLSIKGSVTHPSVLHLRQIKALSATNAVSSFHCVTGWSVPDVPWNGVSVDTLLKHVGLLPHARYIAFYSADGVYVDCLSIEQAHSLGALLAYGIADTPLTVKGGFPLRLVVPGMYGYKSVKWVDRVVVSRSAVTGTWEGQGYPANAYLGSVKTGL